MASDGSPDLGYPHGPQTSSYTPVMVGPQALWPSAAAGAWMSPWPWVTAKATWFTMALAAVWPSKFIYLNSKSHVKIIVADYNLW